LLHLELLGSLDITAGSTGVLEMMGSLVVITTLGNTELVALGAQEVREYWVVCHWLHNISLVKHFDTIVDLSVGKKIEKFPLS
jgi:hypothetical protein